MKKIIALFDLDCTLIDADSEEMWIKFLFRRGLVDRSLVETIENFYKDYETGNLDFTAYEDFLLSSLVSIPTKDLGVLKKAYLEEVNATIRPWMMRLVNWHREQGHELLLITAAVDFLAGGIAKKLQFKNIICTRTEKSQGKFTGKIVGEPAFQVGKVSLLADWLSERQMTLEGSWGYSDSYYDLPLLNIVENPVAVKPDARLRNHARLHDWRLLEE